MYRILIVDDEYYVRKSIVNRVDWLALDLEVCGQAENGQQALDVLDRCAPHIAIVDVRMPVMDGLRFIELARRMQPELRCIILSGHNDFVFAQAAIKLQADDYLLKPVEPEELTSSLRRLTQTLNHIRGGPPPNEAYDPVRPHALALERALARAPLPDRDEGRSMRSMERVIAYIDAHIAGDLRVESIARAFFISPSHLAQRFKAETGEPISSYIENHRIEHSKVLLLQNRLSITEIAARAGYQDPAYFSRAFKRCTGLSPRRYQSLNVIDR